MNWHLLNIAIGCGAFLLFAFIQAIFINGVKASTEEGMIFEKYGRFVKSLGEYGRPLGSCIKCMSSIFGALTFWPAVLIVFGFHQWEFPLYVADVFILVCLTWFIYKRT